jgi:uncharacterized membrane protein YraQ (UPF0718 family)
MTTKVLPATRLVANRRLVLGMAMAAGILALALVRPNLAVEALRFAAWNLVQTSPMIAIGVMISAAVTASGSMGLIAAAFAGRPLRMILLAALIGALTPVCGMSVLPLVAGLLAAGVPLAPIMAFWLSSPVTDPGMLAITAATLGWPFALAKTAAAFVIGIVGGFAVKGLVGLGCLADPIKAREHLAADRGLHGGCSAPVSIRWRFWQDQDRVSVFRRTALSNGRLIVTWLSVAFVAEFLMQRYLPAQLVAEFVGADSAWAVPLAAIVGGPIYLDGYAALPLVRGLIDAGMRPDAALSFLIAGGITSAWAAIPVFALVRLPVFITYLALAILSAMLAGWIAGLLLT